MRFYSIKLLHNDEKCVRIQESAGGEHASGRVTEVEAEEVAAQGRGAGADRGVFTDSGLPNIFENELWRTNPVAAGESPVKEDFRVVVTVEGAGETSISCSCSSTYELFLRETLIEKEAGQMETAGGIVTPAWWSSPCGVAGGPSLFSSFCVEAGFWHSSSLLLDSLVSLSTTT